MFFLSGEIFGLTQGDEIDALNDSWLFLIWTSDHSPHRSNSVLSRWPIAIIPQSLYVMDDAGTVNLTIAAATYEIMRSFNKLSGDGIKLREFRSRGAHEVPSPCNLENLFVCSTQSSTYGCMYWENIIIQKMCLNHTCWKTSLRLPVFVSMLWDFAQIGKPSNKYLT